MFPQHVGHHLTLTERVQARYWAEFFAFSAGLLAYFLTSLWAVEPPRDVIVPYSNPVFGYVAFGIGLAVSLVNSLRPTVVV